MEFSNIEFYLLCLYNKKKHQSFNICARKPFTVWQAKLTWRRNLGNFFNWRDDAATRKQFCAARSKLSALFMEWTDTRSDRPFVSDLNNPKGWPVNHFRHRSKPKSFAYSFMIFSWHRGVVVFFFLIYISMWNYSLGFAPCLHSKFLTNFMYSYFFRELAPVIFLPCICTHNAAFCEIR